MNVSFFSNSVNSLVASNSMNKESFFREVFSKITSVSKKIFNLLSQLSSNKVLFNVVLLAGSLVTGFVFLCWLFPEEEEKINSIDILTREEETPSSKSKEVLKQQRLAEVQLALMALHEQQVKNKENASGKKELTVLTVS